MNSKKLLVAVVLLTFAVSACSMSRKRRQRGQASMPTAAENLDRDKLLQPPASEPVTTAHEDVVSTRELAETKKEEVIKTVEENVKAVTDQPIPVATIQERPAGVASAQAMKWLKNGNIRYLKAYYRKDGKSGKDRERLYKGQNPHSIILSCSDSRVPPEHIFDQALGEILVIRVAGEALDSSVVASIEHAVEKYGTNNIVVMGHTQCDAIEASIKTPAEQTTGSADLDKMLSDIRPRVSKVSRDTASHDLYRESSENAKGVTSDLLKRSALIRQRVSSGEVTLSSAIYNINTGIVDFEK